MGFISNTNEDVKIVAKLTPYGRQQILSNSNNNVFKFFSLGDSEANYTSPHVLENGDIPSIGGDITTTRTMTDDYEIKHRIIVDSLGNTKKGVETGSNTINTTKDRVGQTIIPNDKIIHLMVNRDDSQSDRYVNLLYSLGLPITDNDKALFETVGNNGGGFYDTALETLNNDLSLILSVDNEAYGELIDGKSLKLVINTATEQFNVYGTFQNNLTPKETQDNKLKEITSKSKLIGNNVIFLFSDQVKPPNGDTSKSWSNGYDKTRPFSVNGKELFNLVDNTNTGLVKDECVGVAYLDKGIVVITHPSIVDTYDINNVVNSNVQATFNSIVTKISQDVTCIVGRGEFISSTNKTYNNEAIRVSEIGIYDGSNKLVALAKPNKHLIIGNNEFMAIGVKISV